MDRFSAVLIMLLLAFSAQADSHADCPPQNAEVPAHPYVAMETTLGTVRLELDGRRAPITVCNFLKLVDSGYYDGTVFHRVIPEFMAQGGGYTPDLKPKEPEGGIVNESGNGLSNVKGTIAMARTRDPHSANAQFFINVADNDRLDPSASSWGYAVFGYVIEGMDVVERMVAVPTGPGGRFRGDVPTVPIVIKKMSRFEFE